VRDVLERLTAALEGRYEIRRELGSGGMATVFLAADLKHDRDVALKVLRPEVAAAVGPERFLREIAIAANLSHPNILPLHDSGEAGGLLYFVMPYVDGESLRQRLSRGGPMGVDEVVRIAAEVAEALDFAHERGIVHRDVKPENVLITSGHAVVTDFGIALALGGAEATRQTSGGYAVGTPAYLSPEACAGERTVDGRADQYALACVVYELLTGETPFTGTTALAVIGRHLAAAPPDVGLARKDAPAHLAAAIARGLSKLPEDRFPTAAEFARALAEPRPGRSALPTKSIAVLPFANLSGSEDEYFCDGMTEEITTALAKFVHLRVAARTSAYAYKRRAEDVRAIGRSLGVRTVLEGSIRRDGRRLRVTAQLIDVADGYHLWSERYDRELADVFAIQDEIAANIAGALEIVLSDRERISLERIPTSSLRAYEFYLRGRQFFRETRRRSLAYAREMFQQAIAADPGYALAYAGLADACTMTAMFYPPGAAEMEEADGASRRALELSADLPEAHASRGFVLWQLKRMEEAVPEFETAIRLDPKQFEARYFYARACFQRGDVERAATLFEEAARVREDYQARFFAAQSYAALGRADEARAAYARALVVAEEHLALNPDDPRAATMCAVAACRTGRLDEGLAWARRAVEVDPEDAGVRYNVACLFALEGRPDEAIANLEEAYRHGFGNREWIAHDPDLDSLRADPRFQRLLVPD